MVEIDLSHNPFTLQTKLKIKGTKLSNEQIKRLCGAEGTELSKWSANFFQRALAEFNDDIRVSFSGIQRDYEFLEDALKSCPDKGSELCAVKIVEAADRLQQLRALFEEMQKNAPFASLKTKELKNLFDRATNSEFEMAVVATVSSGKSTLINAMLCNDLLPARNEPTTAMITRIHDVHETSGFRAVVYDAEGRVLQKCDSLTRAKMNELNDNPKVAVIDVYGKIPGIASDKLRLLLTDTPGPNNSRTTAHRNHTYQLLKDEYKPMILYILNATSLEVNDDDLLLRDVANAMKSGARQDRDRFLFVLNKADEFDPENGETVPRMVDKVRAYLANPKHGISEAQIFPTASRMAKVLRQNRAGLPLTELEEDVVLPAYERFVQREWRHFSDFAPLSKASRNILNRQLEEAKNARDLKAQALIYTGVPAVELAINEYLEKYALPAKITKGVATFKDKIAELKLEADTVKAIAGDAKKLEELRKAITQLEKLLEKTDIAQEVKRRIEALNVDSEIKKALAQWGTEVSQSVSDQTRNMSGEVSLDEAREHVDTLVKTVLPELQGKFTESLMTALDGVLRVQAQQCIEGYKKAVEGFLGKVECPDFVKPLLQPDAITVDEAVEAYAYDRTVVVGTHQEHEKSDFFSGASVRSTIAGWLGMSSFFGKQAYVTVKDYGRRSFVDFDNYMTQYVLPAIETFEKNTRDNATNWAQDQATKLKNAFTKRLGALDETIRRKINEQKALLSDADKKEQAIARNRANLEWLNEFIGKLDGILSITDRTVQKNGKGAK